MKDLPRTILKDLVQRYGTSLAQDPFRCEALLRDTCGTCSREIFVIVSAVRQHVPIDLLAPRHNLPLSLMKGFMMKRLQDELGLSDESARWAVETWAEALDLTDTSLEENTDQDGSPQAVLSQGSRNKEPVSLSDPAQRQRWASALESGELASRLSVIDELGRTGDRECIRLLVSALENDRWRVRNAAYDALVRCSGAAVPVLVEALDDPHESLVTRVIMVLAALQSHDATESLAALLGREQSRDLLLIFALGEIGDSRAISPLTKCLVSPDPDIGFAVASALKKISGK
nr:HEAT repeat domain-containing protein [uncultured Methanoregula sp.]